MHEYQKRESIAKELKKFYSSSQVYLDRLNKHNKQVFTPYIDLCKRYSPIGSSILDAGCGVGLSSYLLAKSGFKVTGIDISPLFISEAKKKYTNQSKLKFIVEDVGKIPFSDQSFDAVYSYDLLEHITDPKTVLKEMSRVLKKGD